VVYASPSPRGLCSDMSRDVRNGVSDPPSSTEPNSVLSQAWSWMPPFEVCFCGKDRLRDGGPVKPPRLDQPRLPGSSDLGRNHWQGSTASSCTSSINIGGGALHGMTREERAAEKTLLEQRAAAGLMKLAQKRQNNREAFEEENRQKILARRAPHKPLPAAVQEAAIHDSAGQIDASALEFLSGAPPLPEDPPWISAAKEEPPWISAATDSGVTFEDKQPKSAGRCYPPACAPPGSLSGSRAGSFSAAGSSHGAAEGGAQGIQADNSAPQTRRGSSFFQSKGPIECQTEAIAPIVA